MNNNSIFRLINNNRTQIKNALKSNNKATNSIELLGCNKEFFFEWIQFQLPYEMNDDEFTKLYDIDHVKPIVTFDLPDSNAQYEDFG